MLVKYLSLAPSLLTRLSLSLHPWPAKPSRSLKIIVFNSIAKIIKEDRKKEVVEVVEAAD